MSTYKQIVYTILDSLKLTSDDSVFTEDHIVYLVNKCRGMLLKQKYSDLRKEIPESNYSTICLDLELIDVGSCNTPQLRSVQKIPNTMTIGNSQIYPINFYNSTIAFISRERMKYVGYNKYLKNIIYASIGPEHKVYLTSVNPQFKYLKSIKFTGIFEDPEALVESGLMCDKEGNTNNCDILDQEIPVEESLIPTIIEMVMQLLARPTLTNQDDRNNAADDLPKSNTSSRTPKYKTSDDE